MTITLELPPEVEARLLEEAARHGQDAAGYVRILVEERLCPAPPPLNASAAKKEWRRAFLEWVKSHGDVAAPSIPLEFLRREHMYEDSAP